MNIITIRASALGDFLDCPARAEAKHLRGLRTPSGGSAVLGTALHRSTAVYDESTMTGAGLTIDDAAGAAVDAIHQPSDDVVWDDDSSPDKAEKIALALHERYCREIAPTQDYAAVEVQCERLEITDIGIALTGTTDRVRRVDAGYGISDVKSGGRAVSAAGIVPTSGYAYQIGVYELLAEKASGLPITSGGEIIGLQTGKTEKGQRVAVSAPIIGARDVLIGDADGPGVLEVIAKMIHSGAMPGNPRSMLCSERYCPIHRQCKYRL